MISSKIFLMRSVGAVVVAALFVAASACAPKIVAVPVVTTPKFPDFVTPAVPVALAGSDAALLHDRAWRFLQAGDLRNAEREVGLALKAAPTFYPAEAAAGYLELARTDAKAALAHFERALEGEAGYTSALVGRGQALAALNREPEALAAFEAALAADPALGDIRRRVEVLRFRRLERGLAAARSAARAGRMDEAVDAYEGAISSSPDSAFLYRELAAVERQKGEGERALEHFRKAVDLDPYDADSLAQIATLLEARGDYDGALAAYRRSLAIEPDAAVEAKRDAVAALVALAKLPQEYRAIETSPQVTRSDLAALIGVRLSRLLQAMPQREAAVITDVRGSWAEIWIMAVARTGVLEPYDNHTFQPRAVARRSDLAQAISSLLAHAAPPGRFRQWQSARVEFTDLPTGHLAYPAASLAVASGVMTTGPDGRFEPSSVVSGAEATEAIRRLEAIAGSATRR